MRRRNGAKILSQKQTEETKKRNGSFNRNEHKGHKDKEPDNQVKLPRGAVALIAVLPQAARFLGQATSARKRSL